jgi:hypothetical protein
MGTGALFAVRRPFIALTTEIENGNRKLSSAEEHSWGEGPGTGEKPANRLPIYETMAVVRC